MSIMWYCVSQQKTPDDDFIIDKHPQHSNIIIGVGFTGKHILSHGMHSRSSLFANLQQVMASR